VRLIPPGDPVLTHTNDLAAARAHVVAALPGEPAHDAHRARMLTFLADHPDALERACADGHLTGSAMVVDPGFRPDPADAARQPGALVPPARRPRGRRPHPSGRRLARGDRGARPRRPARRRPAVDLDIHEVGPPHGPHLHLDVRYLVVAPPGAVPVGNHESRDLRWAIYHELPAYGVDDGLLRLGRAALSALATHDGQ
jgi:hypothetical protein